MTSPSIRRHLSAGLLLVLSLRATAESSYTTPYVFTTLAGQSSVGSTDGPGSSARFAWPHGMAVDAQGNIYVTDGDNQTVRKITPAGVVSTFAGVAGERGTVDGDAVTARLDFPFGAAMDRSGNLYVADLGGRTIRKITPAGVVSTFAGKANEGGTADGPGADARFRAPTRIAIDGADNLYVTDRSSNTIRKITSAGVVSTFAGKPDIAGNNDGIGTEARFASPVGIVVGPTGDIFVADSSNATIRRITSAGVVSTLVGKANQRGYVNATGADARFVSLDSDLVADATGNLYVGDLGNFVIRKITPTGIVSTLAGTAGTYGSVNGIGLAARFYEPTGLALDKTGHLYVGDQVDFTVRKIVLATGEVSSFAGLSRDDSYGSADGAAAARFRNLASVAIGPAGELYVADPINSTIRKITPDGSATTFAGQAGQRGHADGTGSAARLDQPYGVAVDASGTVYVSDPGSDTIRKITPAGVVTTLAGDPVAGIGYVDGAGRDARFAYPYGITVDQGGTVYVADTSNHAIRKITPAGTVSTLAGTPGVRGSTDGPGSIAQFSNPCALAIDVAGNLFIADTGNRTVRKIAADGTVSTLAGLAAAAGSADGNGAAARFQRLSGIAVDANGIVYASDDSNQVIRRISPTGQTSTLGGLVSAIGNADGVGAKARFLNPPGVAVGPGGKLYVTSGTVVRQGLAAGQPRFTTHPQSQAVTTGATLQLNAIVSASPEPTYQWQLNGQPVAGATATTLTLANVRTTDAGHYTLVATNALGSATSNPAIVTVNAFTLPPSTGTSSGGGGAPSYWFIAALALLTAFRRLRRF